VQMSSEAFTIVSLCVLSIQLFNHLCKPTHISCLLRTSRLDPSFTLTIAPIDMTQASPSVAVALAQQSTPLSSPSLPSSLIQTMPSNSQITFIAFIAFITLWSVNRLRIKIKHRSILMIS
jgi:hypothetical protein